MDVEYLGGAADQLSPLSLCTPKNLKKKKSIKLKMHTAALTGVKALVFARSILNSQKPIITDDNVEKALKVIAVKVDKKSDFDVLGYYSNSLYISNLHSLVQQYTYNDRDLPRFKEELKALNLLPAASNFTALCYYIEIGILKFENLSIEKKELCRSIATFFFQWCHEQSINVNIDTFKRLITIPFQLSENDYDAFLSIRNFINTDNIIFKMYILYLSNLYKISDERNNRLRFSTVIANQNILLPPKENIPITMVQKFFNIQYSNLESKSNEDILENQKENFDDISTKLKGTNFIVTGSMHDSYTSEMHEIFKEINLLYTNEYTPLKTYLLCFLAINTEQIKNINIFTLISLVCDYAIYTAKKISDELFVHIALRYQEFTKLDPQSYSDMYWYIQTAYSTNVNLIRPVRYKFPTDYIVDGETIIEAKYNAYQRYKKTYCLPESFFKDVRNVMKMTQGEVPKKGPDLTFEESLKCRLKSIQLGKGTALRIALLRYLSGEKNAESKYESIISKIESLVTSEDNKESLFVRLIINGNKDKLTIPGIAFTDGLNVKNCLSDFLTVNAKTDEELNFYYNNSLEWLPHRKRILEIYSDVLKLLL